MTDAYIKRRAVGAFVNVFGGSVEILSPSDVFCKVFDNNNNLIAYIDVIVNDCAMVGSYPLKLPIKKIARLMDKRLNPTIIWAFIDGIIYCKLKNISGEISFSKPDDTSPEELIVLVTKRQKFVKFT